MNTESQFCKIGEPLPIRMPVLHSTERMAVLMANAGFSVRNKSFKDKNGNVDLGVLFDAEAVESGLKPVPKVISLSARASFKDKDGRVDLAALFDAENEANGLEDPRK